MRVLFCRSNPIDPDPRVEKEAAALCDAGYSVSVVAWDRTGSLPRKERRENYAIHRLSIESDFARGLGNLPDLLRWLFGLTGWLVRYRKKFEIIHACDFDTIYPALFCKLVFRKKVIYDIFDFYADHLRATPGWIKSIIRRLDFLAIRLADGVILVDECRKEQIEGSKPKRISVIYNSPRDRYEDFEASSTGQIQGLRMIYVGLIQVERGLRELLEVLRWNPSWSLDMAGFGGDESLIVGEAQGMENVRWHGRIPYRKTLGLTASCDVSIATYDPAIPNHRYASPNKIYEAMMLAKPVIVARGTHMDRVVEEWRCGLVVEYGDSKELERTLMDLDREPDLREKLGKNGREAYQSRYSWSTMQGRLRSIYNDVTEGQAQG